MNRMGWITALILIVIQTVIVTVLIPTDWVERVEHREYQWLGSTHTEDTYQWIRETGQSWHQTMIHDSGVSDGLRWMFFPDQYPPPPDAEGMEGIGHRLWFPFLEERGRALDRVTELTLVRIAGLVAWMPLFLLALIPALWDGVAEWRLRQHTFDYPSPLIHRYGVGLSGILLLATFLALLSPVPIPPMVMPLLVTVTLAITGMLVIGNLPKSL